MAELAAKTAARSNIVGKLFVQARAAAEGVIKRAAMSTTPTVWIPMVMARTVRTVKVNRINATGRPMAAAKSSLKVIN